MREEALYIVGMKPTHCFGCDLYELEKAFLTEQNNNLVFRKNKLAFRKNKLWVLFNFNGSLLNFINDLILG